MESLEGWEKGEGFEGFEGWEEGEGLEGFEGWEEGKGLEGCEGPGVVLDSLEGVRLEAGADGGVARDWPGLAGDFALLMDWEALPKPLSMSR